MSRSTTRRPVKRQYDACLLCESNIPGYGKCYEGFVNYYYRKTKNNGCTKCKKVN